MLIGLWNANSVNNDTNSLRLFFLLSRDENWNVGECNLCHKQALRSRGNWRDDVLFYLSARWASIKTCLKCGMGGHYCRIVSLNVAKSMKVNGNNSRIGAICSRQSHMMPMGDAIKWFVNKKKEMARSKAEPQLLGTPEVLVDFHWNKNKNQNDANSNKRPVTKNISRSKWMRSIVTFASEVLNTFPSPTGHVSVSGLLSLVRNF